MAKTSAVNLTAAGAWQYGNAAGDAFAKEDVQNLGANADLHNHGTGKGLPIQFAGAGSTTAGATGLSGTNILVGDGTNITSLNIGAWTTFAPVLNQGSAVAATVNIAHYLKQGRRAEIFIQMTASANGTAGQAIIVSSLPAAILPATNNGSVISGLGYISSAPARIGALSPFTSGQLEIIVDNAGILGVAPAITLANGTVVTMWGSWETAS